MKDYLFDEDKRGVTFIVIAGLSLILSFFEIFEDILPFDLAWIAILLCGIPIIKEALEGLIREFDIKADVLVSIALVAAVYINEIFAAGEIAFIMSIGAYLEERTVAKARAGIEKLIALTPQTARVVDGESEQMIPVEQVQVGDIVRMFAGETVAVDGLIVQGKTSINQAVMTGESLPVDKGEGDEVFSGTLNQFGTIDIQATNVGEDSSLQRMIALVESADANKAKIVGVTDRWATWIVWIALLSAVITWGVTGELIRAVTILVVFCPCALVLATPTAIMAAIGNVTKYGILVRHGDALERLASVSHLTFDKTGTLTNGTPVVVDIQSFAEHISAEQVLSLVTSAELRSEHPLGKAVVTYYKTKFNKTPEQPQTFTMIPGRGVVAKVNEKTVLAGNRQLFADYDVELPQNYLKAAARYVDDGGTIVYVAVDGTANGFVALADTLRKDAGGIVDKIKEIGIKSVLLTGDNPQAASKIAQDIGISEVYSECLPADKMAVIEQIQNADQRNFVCMVGDGVNDAPALKKAHVGIAMGGIGSDIAVDAADIVLIGDDIKVIPHLLKLSQKTLRTITFNLSVAMLLNFVAIILAIVGILGPVMGALVHNVGSVAVIANSYRLLNWKSDKINQ